MMGSYVLYLLMQAFGALCFAYFAGTIAVKGRRMPEVIVCIGFYLVMGASLVEIWGERGGWTAGGVGLYAALVSTGVALFGGGALAGEADRVEGVSSEARLGLALTLFASASGLALAIGSGHSDAIVDPGRVLEMGIAGGLTRLGPLGWALASPLFIGASIIVVMGLGALLSARDVGGVWLLGAGALFAVWPFDPMLGGLPMGPSIMIVGLTMAFFGLQPPRREGSEEEGDQVERPKDGMGLGGNGPFQRALAFGADDDSNAKDPDGTVEGDGGESDGEGTSGNGPTEEGGPSLSTSEDLLDSM